MAPLVASSEFWRAEVSREMLASTSKDNAPDYQALVNALD
jgi:hypothetical protein